MENNNLKGEKKMYAYSTSENVRVDEVENKSTKFFIYRSMRDILGSW